VTPCRLIRFQGIYCLIVQGSFSSRRHERVNGEWCQVWYYCVYYGINKSVILNFVLCKTLENYTVESVRILFRICYCYCLPNTLFLFVNIPVLLCTVHAAMLYSGQRSADFNFYFWNLLIEVSRGRFKSFGSHSSKSTPQNIRQCRNALKRKCMLNLILYLYFYHYYLCCCT
jgi:hypothetical protein